VQEIAKTAINDARLTPTPKPEVEIWRKQHKQTMPLCMGAAGNTILPGQKYTSVPNGILIDPAVWPE